MQLKIKHSSIKWPWLILKTAFFLYLLSLPFTRTTPIPALPVRIAYADICYILILLSAWWIWRRTHWHNPNMLRYEWIALGLVGFLGLQTAIFHPSLRSGFKVISFLYLVSLPIVFRQIIREEKFYERVFQVITGFAGLLAAAGVLTYLSSLYLHLPTTWVVRDPSFLTEGNFLVRLRSVGYTPNMFAAFMHVGIVAGLWLASRRFDRFRLLIWLSIGLMGVSVVLCKSRLILGVMISLGIWLLWHRHEMMRLARLLTSGFMIAVLAVGVLVGASLVYAIAPVHWQMSGRTLISWNQNPSPYFFLNVLAGTLLHQHPWTGIGLGHFRDNVPQSKAILQTHAPAFADRVPKKWLRTPRDPHSTYQGLAAETGVFGVGIWCVFLVFLVRSVTRQVAQTQDPERRSQLLALFAGIIGFIVQGVYFDILSLRYFWCLVALTSVMLSQTDEHRSQLP